jgi:hypothetical protein
LFFDAVILFHFFGRTIHEIVRDCGFFDFDARLLPGWCRSADGTARGCIQNQFTAVNDELSVDQQRLHAQRRLVGLFVCTDVTDGLRVEDDDIGIHALLETAFPLHLRHEAF